MKTIEIRGNKRIELAGDCRPIDVEAQAIPTPLRMSVDKSKFSTKPGSLKTSRWRRNRERAGWPWPFWSARSRLSPRLCLMEMTELSDDKLKEKITIKSQAFLDQPQAKESAEKIRSGLPGGRLLQLSRWSRSCRPWTRIGSA